MMMFYDCHGRMIYALIKAYFMLGVHVLSHDLSSEIFINETLKFLAVFGISQTCIRYLISAMC